MCYIHAAILLFGMLISFLYCIFLKNSQEPNIANPLMVFYCFCMVTIAKLAIDGCRMTFAWFKCKTITDYLNFAERYLIISKTIILSKLLETESLEVVRVNPDSNEIECKNIKSGDVKMIKLDEKKTFRELFRVYETLALANDEMALSLQGDELSVYVRNRNY